jgi:uncharacterized protein (DUF952 family)
MGEPVYKIMTEAAFEEAMLAGRFEGSSDDRRDGFIHLSTAHQLEATLAAHFAGQEDLVLLAFDSATLGDQLRWEVSRGSAMFPHLYAPLDFTNLLSVESLLLDGDGRHVVPEGGSA